MMAAAQVSWQLVFAGLRDGDMRLLLLVVAVASMALSVVSTCRQVDAVRHRAGLIALRCAALLLAAAWLLDPVIVRRITEERPSLVPVLVDHSASMDLEDVPASGDSMRSRRLASEELLAGGGPLLTALAAGGDREVVLHGFSDALEEGAATKIPGADSAPGAAIQATLARYRGRPMAGIVIVTDGRRTVGPDAEAAGRAAAAAHVPIVVITTGDPRGPRDLRVTELIAADRALAKESFTVDAVIRASGYRGENTAVILESRQNEGEWQELARHELTIDSDSLQLRETFTIEPQPVGKLHLRARFAEGTKSSGPDPVRTIDILPERLRVLIVAGSTFPEVQFLRTALIRDNRYTCASWLLDADPRYRNPGNIQIERLPVDMDGMEQWDCVVLYDPDPEKWPIGWGELLHRFVAERGGGLVYIAGAQRSAQLLDDAAIGDATHNWLSLLPVVREPGEFRSDLAGMLDRDRAWQMEITQIGQESDLFRFADDPVKNRALIADLPGMYWHLPVTRERPGAVVLARHGDERMRNRYGRHVLIATQLFGPGRTWFVGVDSSYRWRYLGEDIYAGFWARMLSSAARGRMLGSGPLRVSVSPDAAPGVPAQVTVAFRSSDDPLAANAAISARLETPDGQQIPLALEPAPGHPGEWNGMFTPDSAGTWFVRVGTGGDAFVASSSQRFDVTPPQRELRDRTADPSFGAIVAERSSGRALSLPEAMAAADVLQMRRVDVVQEERNSLWDRWPFFALLLFLLFAEWTWRKALRQP